MVAKQRDEEHGAEQKRQEFPIYSVPGLTEAQRERWAGKEYAIQPVTKECGPSEVYSDMYTSWLTADQEWNLSNPEPYLAYVKESASASPRFAWLGHWMEVAASPFKWKHLKSYPGGSERGHRAERAHRTKGCVIDFSEDAVVSTNPYHRSDHLRQALQDAPSNTHARLVVVEDLSRDVIEVLGSTYDMDPEFFRSHIEDYVFFRPRYIYSEIPKLTSPHRQHFCIQSLRGRYFDDEGSRREAEMQSGEFNVQRRLDSDRIDGLSQGLFEKDGASIALTRTKTSFWIRAPGDKGPLTVVLLVDPPVIKGHSCWGGHQPFEQMTGTVPWSKAKDHLLKASQYNSFFEQLVFWQEQSAQTSLDSAKTSFKFLALPALQMITAEWLVSLQYMATVVATMEWDIERRKDWGSNQKDIDLTRKMLSPWRRNIIHYQDMIQDMHDNLFNDPSDITPPDNPSIRALRSDITKAQRQISEIRIRTEKIQDLVNNENNADAFRQNKSIGRLTLLATLFLPLNFAATFLSMSSEGFNAHSNVLWLFFAIGVPLLACIYVILKLPISSYIVKL